MKTFRTFLAGRWQAEAHGQAIRAPWDGQIVGEVHEAQDDSLEAALQAGVAAQATMAALSPHQRREILFTTARLLREREQLLAPVLAQEAGKPLRLARSEVQRAADTCQFAAEEAGRPADEAIDLGNTAAATGRYGIVRRFPRGLIAAITPFNFPLNLVVHKLAPAIAAGCPVVLKPAPQAPLSAFHLAEILQESGLPAGGLSVLWLDNQRSERLATDKRVKLLTFTGSDRVGWHLHRQVQGKPVLLELGGNAACIVWHDADLKHAAERICSGAFAYAGQTCISVQRVLVHRSVQDELLNHILEVAKDFPCGSPLDERVLCGPVIDRRAAERIQAVYDQAIALGGKSLVRGNATGTLLSPSIFLDVPADAHLQRQELFGPGLCVDAVDDFADAIARANDSPFGLQAGIFTRDIDRI